MIIEFEKKIILTAVEKKILTPTLIEVFRNFKDEPENISTYIDRLMDDLSNIFKARKQELSKSVRMKPDDKGDNEDGTINVTTD